MAVVDPAGIELPAGAIGEIVYRPQHANLMTLGYWRRPAETGDWFHSGDLGSFDDDGFLFFRGRMTDSLRRRGENVSAYELEGTLRGFPGVADCAAIGVRDELGGEDEIKVFVTLEAGAELDPAAFFAFCEANLPRFAVPRFVELIEDALLVRSAGTGVVQKHRLPRENGPLTGTGMTDLDHVAVAVADIDRTLDQLDAMGATLYMGERVPGFQYAVARLGDAEHGMNLEVLTPWQAEKNDFLARFLAAHGDGPHHLSFVLDDVRPLLGRLSAEGLEPVQVKLGWAPWEDGFVLAHGTVVQVAGTSLGYPPMAEMLDAAARDEVLALPCLEHGTDRGWWTGRTPAASRVALERVVLGTRDLPGARRLFGELLGGIHAGEDEYVWPRGARLRLVADERDGIQGLDVSRRRRAGLARRSTVAPWLTGIRCSTTSRRGGRAPARAAASAACSASTTTAG